MPGSPASGPPPQAPAAAGGPGPQATATADVASAADPPTVAAAPDDPHRPALALAAALLAAALQINDGFYSPSALALVGTAFAAAWAALLAPRVLGRWWPDRDGPLTVLLAVVAAGQIGTIMRAPIAMYLARPMPADHPGFVPGLMLAALAVGLASVGGRTLRRVALTALVGAFVWLGLLTYRGSPDPRIDVVTMHAAAFDAVRAGRSPYSITFPDIYRGRQAFYPPGMVQDGVVHYGFTYPPLSLLMAWPGDLLGDFRYAELAAMAGGGVAIAAAGGGSAVAVLAAAVLLFTPRAFFALEQAWTEPFAVLWLALGVWLWRAGRRRPGMLALGLAVAAKQYVVLAVPLSALLARRRAERWRVPAGAGAVALATVLPALAWDAGGLVHSAILVQVRERLREDALSVAVPWAHIVGSELPVAAYVGLVLVALAVSAWRAPRTAGGFTVALAVTLFTAFAFGKKAFCNYYVCVLALLALGLAVSRGTPEVAPAAAAGRREPGSGI